MASKILKYPLSPVNEMSENSFKSYIGENREIQVGNISFGEKEITEFNTSEK